MNPGEALDAIEAAARDQKARAFDIYALGPLLIYASFASGKGALGRWPRRALFTAGAFAILYNLGAYREALRKLQEG